MISRKDKKRKKAEKILVGLIVLVILLGIIYGLFFYKKEAASFNNMEMDEQLYSEKKFSKLEKISLEEENQVIKINKKKIFIKKVGNYLYIDDKMVDGIILENDYIYLSDYLIFIYGNRNGFEGVINIVNEEGLIVDNTLPFVKLVLKNGDLLGKKSIRIDNFVENIYYKISYNGKNINYIEIYPELNKVENLKLTNKDLIVEINSVKVKLKVIDNVLYFNDKKFDEISFKNVYLTNYLLLITDEKECENILSFVIDDDGNFIKIHDNNYQIRDLYIKNKGLNGFGKICPCDNCSEEGILINYDGKEVLLNIRK